MLLNNFTLDENNNAFLADLNQANFNNCIIFGNDSVEILLDEISDNSIDFNFKFTNCQIRFNNNSNFFNGPNYDFNNEALYEQVIRNGFPDFKEPYENDLRIGENADGIGLGNTSFSNAVPEDILGEDRTTSPDLGAYQHSSFDD